MKKILVGVLFAGTMAACGTANATENTYCLEEQERNGFDYMVVTDLAVCDIKDDDVEIYTTTDVFSIGDIAYVEKDGNHKKSKSKNKIQVVTPKTVPPYTPAKPVVPQNVVPKGVNPPKANVPPPAPKVNNPAPAPVQNKPAPVPAPAPRR